jgi:ankyrin repeat protein
MKFKDKNSECPNNTLNQDDDLEDSNEHKQKKRMTLYSCFVFNKLVYEKKIRDSIDYIANLYNPDNNITFEQSIIITILKGTEHYSSDELNELINGLIDKNINFYHQQNNQNLLIKAMLHDNILLTSILLNQIKNLPEKLNQCFPLHLAIQTRKINFVKDLLSAGCDYNLKDDDGFTPVAMAVLVNNIEIVKYLYENYRVDINSKNNKEQSPLFLICNNLSKNNTDTEEDILEIMEYLIDKGSNVNDRDKKEMTPLMTLVSNLNEYTQQGIILLIDSGANPNLIDKYGNSALLILLSQNEHHNNKDIGYYIISCMMTLINCGAYNNHINNFGEGIYDFMSEETLKYYNLCSSLNHQILKKESNKIFIKKECLICFENKKTMVFLTSCHHIVVCRDCFNIMQNYNKKLENKITYKCSLCNIESISYKIVEFTD